MAFFRVEYLKENNKGQTKMYKDTVIKVLKNPLFILAGICLGIYLGAYYPHYGKQTEKYGHLYLTALKMSVIPFIFASVTLGVSRFFDKVFIEFSFVRFLIVSAILLTLMSCIGALSATFFKPGKLDPQQISNIIESTGFVPSKEIELTHPIDYNKKHDFIEFLNQFFPENIFRAFSEGNILQIIAFSIIFGTAIGVYKNSSKNDVITPLLTLIQDSLLIITKQPSTTS